MPVRLATPMLSVDPTKMHKVDTRNVENLFGMWTVFSRCADSMEDGRRLENLSWRIWNRETLCCESQPQLTTTPAIDFSRPRPPSKDVPELSSSVESIASDAAGVIEGPRTAPVDIRSHMSQDNKSLQRRSRGREKHITSLGLEKMVYSIKEKQDIKPLSPSIAGAVTAFVPPNDIVPSPALPELSLDSSESSNSSKDSKSSSSTRPSSSPSSDRSAIEMDGSDTSVEPLPLHHVVRGFSPYHISSSYRSNNHLAPSPIPTKSLAHVKIDESRTGKTACMFQIGGSSGEDDSSFDEQMCHARPSPERHSSLTAALKRPSNPRKQTSFRDELDLRALNHRSVADEEVFESDDEEDVPESAIEDDEEEEEEEEEDDGSDWEDSVTDNGEALSSDQNLFKRVDSKPNLVSRRSLLTLQLTQKDQGAFAPQTTRSTPALHRSRNVLRSGPSTGISPVEEDIAVAMHGSNMARSKPIIMTTSNTHPPTLSPRTTRRNMLATELTESLRKHLLWERQQKSTTANAVLKRRHTAFDVTNLQDYPGAQNNRDAKESSKNNSWNHFLEPGLGGYHQTGW